MVALYYIPGSRSFITSDERRRRRREEREKPFSPDQLRKVERTREISHTGTQQPRSDRGGLGSEFLHGRRGDPDKGSKQQRQI